MKCRATLILMMMVTSLVCAQADGAEDTEPAFATWQEAARENGLSEATIASLEKHRILITNDAYKQVFDAYLSAENSVFITSDSLLNAYHILYEESIFRLENAMAARLPPMLRLILENLEDANAQVEGNAALASAAKKRAKLVPAIALKLMDDSFRFENDALDEILTQEVQLIVKAESVGMPSWLGKPDATFAGLDYSRFKPRGFYTRSERLRGYFRAVSWLQSIPFRVNQDEELLAMLMLCNSAEHTRRVDIAKWRDAEVFLLTYQLFIGSGDDWDLMTLMDYALDTLQMNLDEGSLQRRRTWLLNKSKDNDERPQINDQIGLPPEAPTRVAEPNFRIVSAARTPSAVLFQRTTDLRRFQRPYPDGLEVAIALGSDFAREAIEDPQKTNLLQAIDSCGALFPGGSFLLQDLTAENNLYHQYLNALRALVDAPEDDAPDFMKNAAWKIKSCNTVLAGWAQLRHTWSLQAKTTVHCLGMMEPPPGFVEPEPEFFSRMADLAGTTRILLEHADVFAPNYDDAIASIEKLRGLLNGVKDKADFRRKASTLSREEMFGLNQGFMMMETHTTEADRDSEAYFKEQRQWLDSVAADIKQGRIDNHPKLKAMLKQYDFDLDELWDRFEIVCRRLEALSHKQLRHEDLNASEIAFIQDYGSTLAGIMFYGGNAYLTPQDDAPRVVDVFDNPQQSGYLHVGIARPRKLYVLYPWKGRHVLCEGAVLPYYEFVATSRLTDESWKARLDSAERPSIPEWFAPVVNGGALSQPSLEDGD